ncbi:MAG: hypothetical protein MJ061_01300 [Mailhella sp.]|nr:hypothetical protein [Mailhella sp.]
MIHCAICYHDGGEAYKAVYCALLSCFMNTQEKVHVHARVDDTVEKGRPYLEELCARFGNSITFYGNVDVPEDVVAYFPGGKVGDYTSASLYRFCLHEQLPEEVDKVLYFDFDIIFERDAADFWNIPFDGAWCVATHDPERVWSKRKKSYYLGAMGIREDRYFNSGVLLMDLRALRAASKDGNVFFRCYRENLAFFRTLKFPVFDQDLMNFMLSGDESRLKLTDSSFNYEVCLLDRRFMRLEELKGRILHFPSLKPWQKFFPASLAYWKYFALSPWGGDTMGLIEERMFSREDRIWPLLMAVWRRHASLRWLNRFFR